MIEPVTAVLVLSIALLAAWRASRARDGRVLAPTRREAGTWACSACGATVDVSGPHVSIDIHSEDRMKMEKYHRRCAPGDISERDALDDGADGRASIVRQNLLPPEWGEPVALAIPTDSGIKFRYLPAGEEYPETVGRAF